MKPLFPALLSLVFLSLGLASPVLAKAPVWKVSKGDDFLYLAGTVHMLSESDYPLPEAFESAYQSSDDIVLETDVKAFEALEVQGDILSAMSYQDHRGLSSVLDRETYSQLESLLSSRGISIAVFDRFTPAGAMMVLTQFELTRLGLIGVDGVDTHFGERALNDNKQALFLESLDQQLSFIQSMNELEPNLVIKSGINDINRLETMWADLLVAWRSGDLAQLEKIGIDTMRRDFPSMYQTLLVKRNDRWLAQLERLMLSEEKEFILVGALHMAGDDGLIHRLKADGYTVTQLD